MTAALEGCEWSAARLGLTLPPGKTRYPFYRRVGGPQGRSGRAESLVPTGIWFRAVQPVVSRYTDWATRPIEYCMYLNKWRTRVGVFRMSCRTRYKFSACLFLQSGIRAIVGGSHWWHTVAYMARGIAFKSLPLRTDPELNNSVGISNLTFVSWNCDLPFLCNAPVHTGPGAHPASCTMCAGSFPGVKRSWGVTLTPHPFLVPWSRGSRAIPLQPVGLQSLSACTRVQFTYLFSP